MNRPDGLAVTAIEAFEHIIRDSRVNGVNYHNVLLSGPGINDTHDPDVLYDPILASSCWPGRIGFPQGHKYITHAVNEHVELNMNDERVFTRALILGASIQGPAMDRYRAGISQQERDFMRRAGTLIVPSVVELCYERQAPVSYVIIGKVERSEHIAVGERIAALYFPLTMPPKASLGQIRMAVKATIAEETL